MDSYKPILTKESLKKLCNKAVAFYDTPLAQSRKVINEISHLRSKRLIEYKGDEWQDDLENKSYMEIAREYHRNRLACIKASKENRPNNK
jgi:hypothetical protein